MFLYSIKPRGRKVNDLIELHILLISSLLMRRQKRLPHTDTTCISVYFRLSVCVHFRSEINLGLLKMMIFIKIRPGILSMKGQGHFNFAKDTSIGKSLKVNRTLLKGHQGQDQGQQILSNITTLSINMVNYVVHKMANTDNNIVIL